MGPQLSAALGSPHQARGELALFVSWKPFVVP